MTDSATVPIEVSIRCKSFKPQTCDVTYLPFIKDVKVSARRTERKFWHVPKIECYGTANALGAQYAADLIQYLKDNPHMTLACLLANITQEMPSIRQRTDSRDKSHGIVVGFWEVIEKSLTNGADNHYSIAMSLASRTQSFSSVQE